MHEVKTHTLSEMERLKAENLRLRAQAMDLKRMLVQSQLDVENANIERDRQILEDEFRVSLEPEEGHVFNWQTLAFEPPKEMPNG